MFVSRDAVVQVLGFVISLALAWLLSPEDFGITTLGLTIVSATNMIADGGIAASLISRNETPTRAELGAVSGFQLCLTIPVAIAALPVGFAFGGDGPATAVILQVLPLYALRTPPLLLLERRLEFGPKILIEITELVSYGVVAIGLALLGLGVWAMPIALVVRTAAGTALAYVLSPIKWTHPSIRFDLMRPLLGFGVRFQMKTLVQLARDLAVVSLVGGLGGLTDLGYYGFCTRLLALPQSAATAIGQVTFPAFSRLMGNREDVGPVLERATATVAILNALLIAPAIAASPAVVPLIFGSRWAGATAMLPGLGLSLLIGGPLGYTLVAYLYARGDAKTPFRVAGIINAVVTIGCTAALISRLGAAGAGWGVAAGPLVATPLLLAAVRRDGGPSLWRAFSGPALSAGAGIAVGWWICIVLHKSVVGALVAAAATLCLEVALFAVIDRRGLLAGYGTMKRVVQMLAPDRLKRQRPPRATTMDSEDSQRDITENGDPRGGLVEDPGVTAVAVLAAAGAARTVSGRPSRAS